MAFQHSEAEINRELQSWLSGLGLNSVAVFGTTAREAVKTGVLQRERYSASTFRNRHGPHEPAVKKT